MQKDSRFFDDIARMMSGAASTSFEMKRELEAMVARQMEAFFSKTSLVTREEFEAVKTMAAQAREENEALRAELEALKSAGQAAPDSTGDGDSEGDGPAKASTGKARASASKSAAKRSGTTKSQKSSKNAAGQRTKASPTDAKAGEAPSADGDGTPESS